MLCCSSSSKYKLPKEYELIKVLGDGGFGTVLQCWQKDAKRTVAVKIPKFYDDESEEVPMLERFMCLGLDQNNIVKFFGSFQMNLGEALVFELLDISLWDYILDCPRLLMKDIRTIIKQLATAFDALKSIGVIHSDIKPDNIMMVNHQKQPFKVKLIDFGLAISTSKAKPGMTLQTPNHRAPEIILGLPFSEAIDMWGLGCVMALMIMYCLPFPGKDEYQSLQFIIKLLGQPADHLLDKGLKTRQFFNRTDSGGWRLKADKRFGSVRGYKLKSLDDLKKTKLKNKKLILAREHCIELLKAMLTMDPSERIIPSEVLTHPFITRDYTSSGASTSTAAYCSTTKHETRIEDITEKMERSVSSDFENEHFDYEPPATTLRNTYTISFSGVIMVQPAAPENTLQLEDVESVDSLQPHVNNTLKSVVLDSINEDLHCDPSATPLKHDDTTPIKPDHCSPATTIPTSGVIMVRSAAAEGALQPEDQERADSLQASPNEMSESMTSKRKKKKNCFRRMFSWMKKTVCSCWTSEDDNQKISSNGL